MRERASERERERKKERERQKERERERKRERERERKRERERERRTRAAGGGSKVKTAACRGNRAVEHDWLYHMSVRVSVYFEDYAIHIVEYTKTHGEFFRILVHDWVYVCMFKTLTHVNTRVSVLAGHTRVYIGRIVVHYWMYRCMLNKHTHTRTQAFYKT